MANICSNDILLIGNPKNLAMLVSVMERVSKRHELLTPEGIQEELGFVLEGWGRSYDDAMGSGMSGVNTDRLSEGILELYCTTAWGTIDSYWETLVKWLDLKGYVASSDVDGDYFVTNDPEGIWFTTKYIYDDYGESPLGAEYECFESGEDLAKYLNKHSGMEKTFDAWKKCIDDAEGELGVIREIERDGTQVYPL